MKLTKNLAAPLCALGALALTAPASATEGERIQITGEIGAGKSTLCRAVL